MEKRENENFKFCLDCNIPISKQCYRYHLRTNIHKKNCLLKTSFNNIFIIATAFKERIITYRINPSCKDSSDMTPEYFLNDIVEDVKKLLNMCLLKHGSLKLSFELFANFKLPTSDETHMKSFNTKYVTVFKNTDLNNLYLETQNILINKLSEFQHCESGWYFNSISHLEINVNKYAPLRGGSYLLLPKVISSTKSCLNIKNYDNHCFAWSIVAALFPCAQNANRTSSYPFYSSVLNIKGMNFPPSPADIKLFEKNNAAISVSVYGLDSKNYVTGPLYMTSEKKQNHVNLLYFENQGRGHYCLIKDLAKLTHRQVSKNHNKAHLCESCLQFFITQEKINSHVCSKVLTVLPEKHSKLEFKNYERKQRINFVIYADFESLLLNNYEKTSIQTETYKLHSPSCFAYYICCSHDSKLNKYVQYRGPDCVEVFIKYLIQDVKDIYTILQDKKPMKPMSMSQSKEYSRSSICHICQLPLHGDKVADHDHITSEYRGAAHSKCNILYRVCPFVPVIFHNLVNYDAHLFINELSKYEGEIKVIPKTKEKYITFTKFLKNSNSRSSMQIKFLDSFQFLSSSLDVLSKNMSEKDFKYLRREFGTKEKIDLLRQKGVYPYDYMDSWSRFEEKRLPKKDLFYNSLSCEHITCDEYKRALKIWDTFHIKSMGEYTDLYLKCDVLLLCDIFEKFRNTSLQYYKLDPAYYVTSPGLSWDAMLLYTGVKLDLIDDIEMYEMIERGIRGGLAQCSLRYAKANNKYMSDYDKSKPSSYLIYLDCNNLYGHAMMKKMPVSEFRFLSDDEIKKIDVLSISDDAEFGYILEVDLGYPDSLHSMHSDLPFAPEKHIPPGGKSKKLIANLYDKFNYVTHYVYLKECLLNGLVLRKIHRVITFRQRNFLAKYIDLNTRLRQAATSTFEKDQFKLYNNAIFGKTIENRRKQVDVKLVTNWRDNSNVTNKHVGAEKIISRPNLKSVSIFTENFVAIQLSLEKIILDRPIYVGFSVLEYAKQHMYRFHYNIMINKYMKNVKLCYTDTDSLLYLINTNDFYKDMLKSISYFDTSNFEKTNPYGMPLLNAKIPGLFKDEMGGDIIKQFIGLRAKLYCIDSTKTQIKKAKGVTKSITKKLRPFHYEMTLRKNANVRCKMNTIRSLKHVLYSQRTNKLVLNRNDDKRQVLKNQIHTLPWGHCNTLS